MIILVQIHSVRKLLKRGWLLVQITMFHRDTVCPYVAGKLQINYVKSTTLQASDHQRKSKT